MNECIETLNGWGENFWNFVWPMLWQSSLLIVVLFAFDLLFARRIRASVRYALWMAVLVKLILPPSLALPTGATWWLWRPRPVVEHPMIQNYTVSFGNTIPEMPSLPNVPVVVPLPKLSDDAWVLLVEVAIGMGLLLWLAFRWLRVAGSVRRAAILSGELDGVLEEARQLAGLRRRPRLKLIDEAQAPAVYGLLRPVILLPRAIVSRLSDRQLRAVLLHEAVHLRRGDVWMNCAQTLLQIAYWWHPLLWVANARIRRLREDAVDDVVMLALHDGADAYAPTLLEVAKFAFRRPIASLGLVGILESRSALRQRVERLMEFRPPRKAGITFLSLCGIFAFCAVALPMGQGPEQSADSFSSEADSTDGPITLHVNPEVFIRNIEDRASWTMEQNTNDYRSILFDILENEGMDCVPPHGFSFNSSKGDISTRNSPEQRDIFRRVIEELNRSDGKWSLLLTNRPERKNILIEGDFFWMTGDYLEELTAGATYHATRNGAAPCWTADPGQLKIIDQLIRSSGLYPVERARIQTGEGRVAELFAGNATNSYRLKCDPYLYDGKIVLACKAGSMFTSNGPALTAYIVWGVNGKQTVDNDGGMVLHLSSPGGSSNFVVILHAKIVSPARTSAAGSRDSAYNAVPVDENGISAKAESALEEALAVEHKDAHMDLTSQANTHLRQISSQPGRMLSMGGLDSIRLDQFGPFQHAPLSVVIDNLSMKDPNNISFLTTSELLSGSQTLMDLPKMTNVALSDVLDAIVKGASVPIRYSVMGRFIVFSGFPQPDDLKDELFDPISGTKVNISPDSPSNDLSDLEQRIFYIQTAAFSENVRKKTGETNSLAGFRELAADAGVDLSPPKTVFLENRFGGLSVSATRHDLEIINGIIADLHCLPPMIHIKSWFIEMPKKFFSGAANTLPSGMTNGGVLSAAEKTKLLRLLKSQKGFEDLAEPEVTTLSGRRTQMRVAIIQPVITDYVLADTSSAAAIGSGPTYKKFSDGSSIVPKIEQVETGSILDVVPNVLGDGRTIRLWTTASQIDFFGYASTTGLAPSVATNTTGVQVKLPGSLPVFGVSEGSTEKFLYDGQTLVLFPKPKTDADYARDEKARERIAEVAQHSREKSGAKVLLVLTTATLIDATGSRTHPEDDSRFVPVFQPDPAVTNWAGNFRGL